jgi:hypothetical protein
MKAQREIELKLLFFINLSARWGEWLTRNPGRFNPGTKTLYPFYKKLT